MVKPPAAPDPATDPNTQFESYVRGQLVTNAADQSALSDKLGKDLDGMRAEADKMRADQKAEIDAHMASKPPPIESFNFQPKDVSDMAGMLMVLAALGGSLTRAPLTASLNNMAAMIKGFNEGNATAFEQSYKQFDANYKKGMEAHRAYQDELTALREKHRGDLAALTEAKRDLDLKYGKQESLLNDRGKTLMEIQKGITDERNAALKAQQELDRQQVMMDNFAKAVIANNYHNAQLQAMQADHEEKNRIAQERVTNAENDATRKIVLARQNLEQKHSDSIAAAEKKLSAQQAAEHSKILDKLADELALGKITKQAYEHAVDEINARYGLSLPAQGAAPAPSRVKDTSAPPPGFVPD